MTDQDRLRLRKWLDDPYRESLPTWVVEAIRSLLERLEAAERERDSFLQSYENLDHRHNVMAERLEAAEAPHPCPICTPIHEENERLRAEVERTKMKQAQWEKRFIGEAARVEAALALHKPWVSSMGTKFCEGCSSGYGKIPYPCPTVAALEGEGE